jgi:hypothetical protein
MLNAAELIGKVVDATGGPLHSTTVELRREGDRAVIRSFFTDHSGVFRFTDLNVGTYQLAFSCPGFHLAELTRTVSQEERVALLDTFSSSHQSKTAWSRIGARRESSQVRSTAEPN